MAFIFSMIAFILLILLAIILIPVWLIFYKSNKTQSHVMSDLEWEQLRTLEHHRQKMVERVKTLQTILVNDFPRINIPMIEHDEVYLSKAADWNLLLDQIKQRIEKLENHIDKLEIILDSQLPNWRNK